jgi:beta-glucosidase
MLSCDVVDGLETAQTDKRRRSQQAFRRLAVPGCGSKPKQRARAASLIHQGGLSSARGSLTVETPAQLLADYHLRKSHSAFSKWTQLIMSIDPTKRRFAKVASQQRPAQGIAARFPDGFRWGVATSAFQIEGAVKEDGRGASIWDTYTHTRGKIKNGHNADVANDHYHRYKEDVGLIQAMGIKAYRFSIAWPRIFPNGIGQPNVKGLDFYRRLVDALLEAGIEPFPTLYHWDLPQVLQDKGGWQSRDTAKAFADYAGYTAGQLSDRVTRYFTINEFSCIVDIGHRGIETMVNGKKIRIEHAPGLKLSSAKLNQVRHNTVLAHGLSVQAIRANGKPGTKCGPADNMSALVPAIETPENIKAAEIATREANAGYLTVILEGKYTDAYLTAAGKNAPRFTEEDLEIISSPVDFVGINVYRPSAYVVASEQAPGFRTIPFNKSHPRMLSSWHLLGPEVMYWAPRQVQSLWNATEIYITENGCGASDDISVDGIVDDSDRIMFLRNHLAHLHRATAEGVPVKGYFHWSLMDNFEWSDGFANRFGLIFVDYKTQTRTPKLSAAYFREAAAKNAVA